MSDLFFILKKKKYMETSVIGKQFEKISKNNMYMPDMVGVFEKKTVDKNITMSTIYHDILQQY